MGDQSVPYLLFKKACKREIASEDPCFRFSLRTRTALSDPHHCIILNTYCAIDFLKKKKNTYICPTGYDGLLPKAGSRETKS